MGFFDWLLRKGKKAEPTQRASHQHTMPDVPPADLAGFPVDISSVGGPVFWADTNIQSFTSAPTSAPLVDYETARAMFERQPFRPFRVHLADGRMIDVQPRMFLLTPTFIEIGPTCEKVRFEEITRLEPLPAKSGMHQIWQLLQRYVPEIAQGVVQIKGIARDEGRTKAAVHAPDPAVDPVRACVGDERGSRIKNIVDELSGERIDIVRWNDSPQVLIANALGPAQIEEVFLYPRLRRAIVLVKEDQLSLAIGHRGQNVRLASELVGWDIELVTAEELKAVMQRAQNWFAQVPDITGEITGLLIKEGFLSYHDLAVLRPAQLSELARVTEERARTMILFAKELAEQAKVAR